MTDTKTQTPIERLDYLGHLASGGALSDAGMREVFGIAQAATDELAKMSATVATLAKTCKDQSDDLVAATAELEKVKAERDDWMDKALKAQSVTSIDIHSLENALSTARAENAELRAEVERLNKLVIVVDRLKDCVPGNIREALAELKGDNINV